MIHPFPNTFFRQIAVISANGPLLWGKERFLPKWNPTHLFHAVVTLIRQTLLRRRIANQPAGVSLNQFLRYSLLLPMFFCDGMYNKRILSLVSYFLCSKEEWWLFNFCCDISLQSLKYKSRHVAVFFSQFLEKVNSESLDHGTKEKWFLSATAALRSTQPWWGKIKKTLSNWKYFKDGEPI